VSRLLVIDTATQACSVALFNDGILSEGSYKLLGRGHAEQLVGMIAALPGKGKADAILVNCGPGSFTGIRVGLAAAKALALAWGARLSGYNCLHLVAHMAATSRDQNIEGDQGIYVINLAGHGEVFTQRFNPNARPLAKMATQSPTLAAQEIGKAYICGTGIELLPDQLGRSGSVLLYPDARHCPIGSDDELENIPPQPVYGRIPDAKPSNSIEN